MIRGKGDEEDYWNSSKFKAFTFDDDDEFSQLKESKKAVNSIQTLVDDDDDDEDDVEKVGWNGEPIGSVGEIPSRHFAPELRKPKSQYKLMQYREHLNLKDVNKKKEALKSCISLPFSAEDAGFVQDHYTLLERQIIIEANDQHMEKTGQVEVFKKYPRKAAILNMPIITTLYYSCFYHYGESEINIFQLSDKQYLLTALGARAKLKAWKDVDSLFVTKVIQEYICLVDDTDLKLNLAMKYKCHDIIINNQLLAAANRAAVRCMSMDAVLIPTTFAVILEAD
ncbi:SPE39 protein, partial [Polypterus senegalus]